MTASLVDDDGGVKDITWQWAKSDSVDGTVVEIDGGHVSRLYTG